MNASRIAAENGRFALWAERLPTFRLGVAAAILLLAAFASLAPAADPPSEDAKVDVALLLAKDNAVSAVLANLPRFGHRNWIVIADSAYPAQSRPGIKTIPVGKGHVEIVEAVLQRIDKADHVRPIVYLDAELKYVPEKDAPGIDAIRTGLGEALGGRPVRTQRHEETIHALDEAAKTYEVLILKTDLALPYTSVFIQLDCGYWSAAAEKRLREAMEKEQK